MGETLTRIVAGSLKGHTITVPPKGTRPTSAKVREALFSILSGFDLTGDVRVLDLFAGSGALGLEALSRGATHAVFVEKSRGAQKTLQSNIAKLRARPASTLYRGSAAKYLGSLGEEAKFDVIFVDPPYDWDEQSLTETLERCGKLLTPGGMLVVERMASSPKPGPAVGLELEHSRRWGDTAVWLYGAAPAPQNEVD